LISISSLLNKAAAKPLGASPLHSVNSEEERDDFFQGAVAEDGMPGFMLGDLEQYDIAAFIVSPAGLGSQVMFVPHRVLSDLLMSSH
jgi:hypothetical protein